MSGATKKSIILFIIFLIVAGCGYYWLNNYKVKKLKKIENEKSQKLNEFDKYSKLAVQYDAVSDTLKVLNERFLNKDKILPSIEDSKITFQYFNTLASMPDSYLNFSFTAGGGQIFEDHLVKTYILEGEALFYNLFNFIWKLENYKRLYAIQSLSFEEIKKTDNPEKKPESYIKFSMAVAGYSPKEELRTDEKIIVEGSSKPIGYNPFLPLVTDYIPPNTDNLLEVNEAVLQGLTEDRAYIVDSKGKLLVMQVGSKVYLGYLTKIDQAKKQVEFTLNKGGFIETVILSTK
ncbi:hypothetical protein AMJ80_00695 [bacterium SM23_31]|nr:MAG: hypothetical protein AMJ80_00695 [bacterium SM23_31]